MRSGRVVVRKERREKGWVGREVVPEEAGAHARTRTLTHVGSQVVGSMTKKKVRGGSLINLERELSSIQLEHAQKVGRTPSILHPSCLNP